MPDFDAPDIDAANAPFRGDAILVVDPSLEGAALADALRMRGFAVIELAPDQLDARVIGEAPRAIVVDIDQPGAIDAVERLRELGDDAPAELFLLGDSARAAELGATRASGRAYTRPLDVEAVVDSIALIAQLGLEHHAFGTLPPPPSAFRRPTTPPLEPSSEPPDPPPSELHGLADPFDVGAMLSPEAGASAGQLLPTELSPELAELLDAAEQRVVASRRFASVPSPEEELDILLSPELLAALDEPIDLEEDIGGTGADVGTGSPIGAKRPTTSGTALLSRSSVDAATTTPPTGTVPVPRAPSDARPLAIPESAPPYPPQPTVSASAETSPPAPRYKAMPPAPDSEPAPALRRSVLRPPTPFPASTPFATAPPFPVGATVPLPGPASVAATPAWPTDLVPAVLLAEGDALRLLARAVAARTSGAIAVSAESAVRRIVLRDGDLVTAASTADDESLVAFLAARGDLERDAATRLAAKLPPFGRHAGAALIAHGYLGQDDLWPVLRAHAEWIIGRTLLTATGTLEMEAEPPGRLRAEPGVFGGATGAEVLVEAVRRVIPPETALLRLGGPLARVDDGARRALLAECALRPEDEEAVRLAPGRTLGEIIAGAPAELCDVLYALVSLGVLDVLTPAAPAAALSHRGADPLDEEAIRQRVRARLSLVEDGDYFALLGVARTATGYEVRRAYLELRRGFEPARVLTAQTADLALDVKTIVEVLDEAYEILREPHRRDRYRKAIEAGPP